MQQVLSRFFRARPGEWGAVLLLQALIFLIICILLIVKPTASALFLSEYGAVGLPYMFVATAVLAAIVSTGYSYALRYVSLLRVSFTSLLVCLSILLICAAFMHLPPARPYVAAVLYLWTAIFGVLAASQFWMMANFVFDLRQAKRLFGLIGAGAIAGGIAGGYLTNLLAEEIGARNLIFVAAALLLPCLFLLGLIWRRYVFRRRSMVSRRREATRGYEPPHRLIVRSRHLLLLCSIVALGVIVAKLVDYQFSVLASERYGDQDRLAAFFGFWYSTFNIVALGIQLLLTQRIVQWLGVSGGLMFLPVGLGIGAVAMLLFPGLNAATLSRLVDGSLKQSVSRASLEMLFLPVDEETKKRVKTYIDVFVDSVAGGLGGLLLIALTQVLGLSVASVSWVVLLLVAGWAASVMLIHKEYINAFRVQLSHLRPRPKERTPSLRNHHREIMAGFLEVLEKGELSTHERQLLYVLERTDDLNDASFREPIRQLLSHPSPGIRARALRSLYLQPGAAFVERVIPLLQDEEPAVRAAAFDYLFSRSQGVARSTLTAMLDHGDPHIAGTALVSLVSETATNARAYRAWQVGRRLRDRIAALPELPPARRRLWYRYLLRACGRGRGNTGRAFIERCLGQRGEPATVRQAILAAGENQHRSLIVPLLHLLADGRYRKLAREALVQYEGGLLAVVPSLIIRGELSPAEARQLPSVIERIDHPRCVSLLLALVHRFYPHDERMRMQVLRALNALRRDYPKRPLPRKRVYKLILREAEVYNRLQNAFFTQEELLRREPATGTNTEPRRQLLDLLRQRREAAFERLLRALGLRYPPADIIPVHRALLDERTDIRNSGLEFLDNLLELSLKRVIVPALDQRLRGGGLERSSMQVLLERQELEFTRLNIQDEGLRRGIKRVRA